MTEINRNVIKKDITVSEGKVYLFATVLTILIAFLALVGYSALWGRSEFTISVGKDSLTGLLLDLALYITIMFILIVIHELLHAFSFITFGKGCWKDIKFGILWKSFTPYCHCSRAVNPKVYRISLTVPTIVLGIIPMLIGYSFGIGYLAFIGTFMLIGGIGDLMILFLIRKIPENALVLDHPSKIGCQVQIFE